MPWFNVSVTRKVYQTKVIKVKALDEDDAHAVAIDEAGNYDFSGLEKEAEYEVNFAIVVRK